jgi:hypothetical protein
MRTEASRNACFVMRGKTAAAHASSARNDHGFGFRPCGNGSAKNVPPAASVGARPGCCRHALAPIGQPAHPGLTSGHFGVRERASRVLAGSRLCISNRRRKEANSEGEQHQAAECIDRDVYRTDHLKLAQLIIVSARHEAQRPVTDRAQRAPGFGPFRYYVR